MRKTGSRTGAGVSLMSSTAWCLAPRMPSSSLGDVGLEDHNTAFVERLNCFTPGRRLERGPSPLSATRGYTTKEREDTRNIRRINAKRSSITMNTTATGVSADYTVIIRPSKGFSKLDLVALWEFRELFYFLVWRDVKIRYKQTVIGAAWAIVQPVMTMVVFTVIFGNFAKIPSDGLPYAIFSYTAL